MSEKTLAASVTEADLWELEAKLAQMEQQLQQLQQAVMAHRGAVLWGRDLLERERQRRVLLEHEEQMKAREEENAA